MSELPDIILLKVMEYLTISDLCQSVRGVCHRWNRLSYDLSLWKHLPLSSYGEVVTTWDKFINAFLKVLAFVEVIDFLNCEQLFDSDDKVLWDYVLCRNKIHEAHNNISASDALLGENCTIGEQFIMQPFGCLKRIAFPVNAVDLGFVQMLCILKKDHFPCLNALERSPLVMVPEFLSILSVHNGCWKEIHFPLRDVSERSDVQPWVSVVEFFQQNPLLKVAMLSSSDVEDNDFTAICHLCEDIEDLNIARCICIRDSLHEITNLKHLRHLNVSETTVNDEVISSISKCCPHIVHVNISGCYKITDVGIADLVKHASKLHTLILNHVENNHANITDTGLSDIGRYGQSIRRLEMSHCPNVSDQGICSMTEGCPYLQFLVISGCLALTDKAILNIAENCKMLRSLSADGCSHLTSAGINALVGGCQMLRVLDIATCHHVKGLNFQGLSRNTERQNGCKHEDLASNNICTVMTVSQSPSPNSVSSDCFPIKGSLSTGEMNTWTEQCVIPLVQELLAASKTALTCLDLSNCSLIANDSVRQIASHCFLLRYLSLRGCNRVQDSGVTAILQGCKLLQALDLSGCSLLQASRLTDDTLLSVGQYGHNLVMLDITKTPMISLYGLKSAINGCQTLKRLHISLHPNHIPLYDVVQFLHRTRGHVTFARNALQKTVPEILEAGPNCRSVKVVNNFILKFAAKKSSFYTHGML